MIDDPHETQPRVGRYQANAEDEAWLAALNQHLAAARLPSAAGVEPARLPLIYVVGAPRSGTTLLSQVLSRFLDVGYINNLIARFWLRPSVGIGLSRLVLGGSGREQIAFESEHGTTAGVAGPHEFGYFWRHWLQLDAQPTHHLSTAALQHLDRDGLREALEREILAPFGTAVVFKNVICGFHAEALTQIHAPSLFLHIVRDREATCRSILKAREQRFGSPTAWWSLKPSTYPEIAALVDPAAQVVRQTDDCRAEIAAELGRPGVLAMTIEYERLCREPLSVLHAIADAVAATGSGVRMLDGVPESFRYSQGPQLPSDIHDALRTALERQSAQG
jgi:hypothetical protein